MAWPHQRPRVVPVSRPLSAESDHLSLDRSATSGNATPGLDDVKFQIYEQLLRELDLGRIQQMRGAELRSAVDDATLSMLLARDIPLSRLDRQRLIREIGDEILGLGPLEPLLADATVSEIMVNGPRSVYAEREGLLSLTDVVFRDNPHVMRIIERIISPLGRHIDESSPMVDARLGDGSRVNAIIPPLAVDGPSITIRKFSRDPLSIEDLIRYGTLTPAIAIFLQACVTAKINIVVSGGTGSGKTTLLNILSAFIPSKERIVSIEDPCELQLRQPHVIRLETRPSNIEGRGEIGQRQLVRNALRMRPDRIILGEVRGGEAFDMLQAMNTGHDGSLTTVHANAPRDALARIENMVLMADLDLPVRAIRDQVASAVNLVIQLSRLPDGSRRVTHVSELGGFDRSGSIILRQIFGYQHLASDDDGRLTGTSVPTGVRPELLDKLARRGVEVPLSLFDGPNGGANGIVFRDSSAGRGDSNSSPRSATSPKPQRRKRRGSIATRNLRSRWRPRQPGGANEHHDDLATEGAEPL